MSNHYLLCVCVYVHTWLELLRNLIRAYEKLVFLVGFVPDSPAVGRESWAGNIYCPLGLQMLPQTLESSPVSCYDKKHKANT